MLDYAHAYVRMCSADILLLVWLSFDKAQVKRRQHLFTEVTPLTPWLFGILNLRGSPFAHRAIPRSKIDPRSRPNHRRKAIFLLSTPYEPALGGGECKAVDFVDFDGTTISPSKSTPLEVEPNYHTLTKN